MQTIYLKNRNLEVKQLPLGKFADLLKSFKKLPTQLDLLTKSKEDIFAALPTVFAESLPDFIDFMRAATDMTQEEADNLGVADAIDIMFAIIEENQLDRVFDRLKKVIGQFQAKKPELPAEK